MHYVVIIKHSVYNSHYDLSPFRVAFSCNSGYNRGRKTQRGIHMAYAANVLNSLVSITQFNRGQAARIFDRLHSESQLVVLKNNQPAAVILSPSEYQRLSEIEEDYLLLREAMARLSSNTAPATPMDDVMRELGITEEELDAAEDVVIE